MSGTTSNPVVAVLVPRGTREICFRPGDWARLEARGAVRYQQQDRWSETEAAELMRDAEIVLTGWGTGTLTEAVLAPAPGLELWVHAAGSMAGMATGAVWARALQMTTANDVLARGVAEFALAMTIVALKQVVPLNRRLTDPSGWARECGMFPVRELCDLRVGIAGFGRVGRHLAGLLRSFRGLDVVVSDPFVEQAVLEQFGATRVDLPELCATATVIHNCVPWTVKTAGLFTAKLFQSMPDGAVFINTGRGATVDQAALLAELAKGRLYACLDVTHPEPPAAGSPFYALPNCLLTPHIAGAAGNGRLQLGRFAVDEIQRYLDGKPLEGKVSRREIEGMTGGPG
jgi:phosphoglycerate dehydrogenase-like enzyme